MDEKEMSLNEGEKKVAEEKQTKTTKIAPPPTKCGGGGWGSWGFSCLSVLSNLQKAATVAAEEISRNAAAIAESASKSIADLQIAAEDSESPKEAEGAEESANENKSEDEHDKRRKSLDKLEKASDDTILSQELEALSSHYALIFNRKKGKLSAEQKSAYDGKLKEVQKVFSLNSEIDGSDIDSIKGMTAESGNGENSEEVRNLHDSSVSKAAEMTAGFIGAFSGLAVDDITQRTAGRLDSLHSKGVHRLSEMSCFAVSQLLTFTKFIISSANKTEDEDSDENKVNIEWPQDVVAKAKIIRINAHAMIGYVEAVSHSFITVIALPYSLLGRSIILNHIPYLAEIDEVVFIIIHFDSFIGISDVTEAYQAAIKGVSAKSQEVLPQTSVQEKAKAFSEHLRADQRTAVSTVHDGLQCLSHVVLSTLDAA